MSGPELSVVCKSCGSEVSPYVTECPYCGHRLRKRAPALERSGDEIKVRESRRERRRRERRERAPLREPRIDARPWATIVTLLASAVVLVVGRAVPLDLSEMGGIVGPVGSDYWRYVTAPFAYVDVGALFVIGVAIAIFGSAVERRLGTLLTAIVILASGGLGMLVADGVASAGADDFLVAAGGNGVALGLLTAWVALRRGEREDAFSEPFDIYGTVPAAIVLLLLPLVEVTADPVGGVAGAGVGYGLGLLAARRGVAS